MKFSLRYGCVLAIAVMMGCGGGAPFKTYNHALMLMESGHLDQAENLLLQSLAETPTHAQAWNQLGIIAFDRGDYSLAKERFQHARNYDPLNTAFLNNLALVHMKQNNPSLGVPMMERATVLEPDNTESWIILGTLLSMEGKSEEAVTALETALALDPINDQANALMSRLRETTP